jgi:3-deoxy-manno-octulosonate cytidylyltransferase (CMP-KDO synthetase)
VKSPASAAFKVVIPARLASTRLPGKVLLPLGGVPLVIHVWRAACASAAEEVIIAADDVKVVDALAGFGATVCLTDPAQASGTDRLHEVALQRGWSDDTRVVNLQGDEPLMPPALVDEVARLLAEDAEAEIATLAHPLTSSTAFANPNVVKVVCNARGHALYFSRAAIPCWRDGEGALPEHPPPLRHIGLYAYRVAALKRFHALPPAPLEQCEALEQLRALHHGLRIRVGIIDAAPPHGVDTAADFEAVRQILEARSAG